MTNTAAPAIRSFNGTSSEEQTKISGLSFTPDSNGAVDYRYFVEFLNGVFAIYDKTTGALVGNRISDTQFWKEAKIPHPISVDPRIFFIPDAGLHGQWLAVQIFMGSAVYIATTDPLSSLPDPRIGNWEASVFDLPGNDFPMVGYDLRGIYIGSSTSERDQPRAPQIVVIPRANALAHPPRVGPGDIKIIGPLRHGNYGDSLFPALDRSGIGWPYETAIGIDVLSSRHLTFALVSHEARDVVSHGRIEVPPFRTVSRGYRVRQPAYIDSNVIFDNSSIVSAPRAGGFDIWVAHTVLGPDGGLVVRWYRLFIDPATRFPGLAAWGEIGQPGYDCFNPAILSFGKDDTTVVSFSRSGGNSTSSDPDSPSCGNIGAYVAFVHEGGVQPDVFPVRSGLANNYIPNIAQRWGDYSTICTDPDPKFPRRVWVINQYVLKGGASTSQWCEAIASVDVP